MLFETIVIGGGLLWVMEKLKWGPERGRQEAARRAEEAAKAAAAWRAELHRQTEQCETLLTGTVLPSFFLIDSNIWMNEAYTNFFRSLYDVLKVRPDHAGMILYGPQFDEVCNIKRNTDFGEDKNARARLAINRVEAFQKANLLQIKPITLDAQRGAYADPLILRLLLSVSKQGNKVTLISDDKELRIRARQLVADQGKTELTVIEVDKLRPLCDAYAEVKGLVKTGAPQLS